VFSSKALSYCILRPLITSYLRFIYRNQLLHIIFQNNHDIELFKKNKFLNHLKGHSLLNGSGVDLNFYSQSDLPKNGSIKVLFASRLLKDKGIYDFVDAARILESTHKNIQFFIAGNCDANNPNSLTRAEIEEISLLKNVEYLGQTAHMSALIASIHLLVLPSYYGEGMPKVLLEAAACGRPVITTDNPGCRDAIINNKTGILVPIKSPSAISKSILSLVEDQKKLYEMSCNARSHALAKFDVKNIVREHVKIYDDLMNCDHT
jgi:glycosyltransferase involved in cell wall biosynthesis